MIILKKDKEIRENCINLAIKYSKEDWLLISSKIKKYEKFIKFNKKRNVKDLWNKISLIWIGFINKKRIPKNIIDRNNVWGIKKGRLLIEYKIVFNKKTT